MPWRDRVGLCDRRLRAAEVVETAVNEALVRGAADGQAAADASQLLLRARRGESDKSGVVAAPTYRADTTTIPVRRPSFSMSRRRSRRTAFWSALSVLPVAYAQGRVLDDFQKQAWAQLQQDPTEYGHVENSSTARKFCGRDRRQHAGKLRQLPQHARLSPKKDWKVGDVRG